MKEKHGRKSQCFHVPWQQVWKHGFPNFSGRDPQNINANNWGLLVKIRALNNFQGLECLKTGIVVFILFASYVDNQYLITKHIHKALLLLKIFKSFCEPQLGAL